MNALTYVVAIALVAAVTFGAWLVKREVNAWLYYDDSTKEIICEMVKAEYLRNPEECYR